eukprot:COSAG04_NODE_1965_length_5118_cov_14.211994_5_plen_210_part_00
MSSLKLTKRCRGCGRKLYVLTRGMMRAVFSKFPSLEPLFKAPIEERRRARERAALAAPPQQQAEPQPELEQQQPEPEQQQQPEPEPVPPELEPELEQQPEAKEPEPQPEPEPEPEPTPEPEPEPEPPADSPLHRWLAGLSLSRYATAITAAGYDELVFLQDADQDDIDDLAVNPRNVHFVSGSRSVSSRDTIRTAALSLASNGSPEVVM